MSVACQAQLVNVIAPIFTEPGGPAWRQTIFHPFAQTSRYGRGRVLRVEPEGTSYEDDRAGEVPHLHATAVQADDGTVTLFAVNRSTGDGLRLDADLRALGETRILEHLVLADADLAAVNTADVPDRVRPTPAKGTMVTNGKLTADLPPVSWNMIRIGKAAIS